MMLLLSVSVILNFSSYEIDIINTKIRADDETVLLNDASTDKEISMRFRTTLFSALIEGLLLIEN